MNRNNINSPGAIVGDVTSSTIRITVGENKIEKVDTLSEIKELIALLNKEHSNDIKRFMPDLENAKQELERDDSNQSIVQVHLERFSKIMDVLDKGKELAIKVSAFLIGCGFSG